MARISWKGYRGRVLGGARGAGMGPGRRCVGRMAGRQGSLSEGLNYYCSVEDKVLTQTETGGRVTEVWGQGKYAVAAAGKARKQ